MKFVLLCTVFFSCITQSLFAQQGYTLSKKQVQQLDSIATQDVPPRAPGIATAIIREGKLVYEKWAGYADFSDSSLITKTSRFNIASNGKQFTALAILCLIADKKMALSDDIRKWFPQLYNNIKEKISIENLLTHRSGIRDCYDLWSLQGYTWWKESFSNKDVLALLEKQEALNFKPGTAYLYSNSNYILLAMLVEKVSGKSFTAHMNELFQQLQMPNTSFEDNYTHIRGKIARAYFNFSTWSTYNWVWNVCGDGNLFSTLEDQIQWEKILQGSVQTTIKRELLLKSQQPVEKSMHKNYGYGLEFGQYKGLDYTFHEGATGAWKATVIRFPGKKIAMLTLTNTGKSIPSMQTREMADVVFGLKADAAYVITRPASIGPFVADEELAGTYLTDTDFSFQFEKKEGKIFLKRIGRNDVELEREAANIFHQKYDTAFKQAFTKNKKGQLQVTAYYINHSPYTLTKQVADFSGIDLNSLSGTYHNTETNTSIWIGLYTNNHYPVKIGTSDTTQALLITPDKLLVNNYVVKVEYLTATATIALYLNGDRIKKVKYTRQN